MKIVVCAAIFLTLSIGLYQAGCAVLLGDRSYVGRKSLRKMAGWNRPKQDLWAIHPICDFVSYATRFVYLDPEAQESLEKQLDRVGLQITPQQFTARKYVIAAAGVLGIALCAILKFWMGVVLAALLIVYGMMRQRDRLLEKIKKKDAEIADEMPRFVRTVCQQLHTNRDITAALLSYRKVAGKELGAELDILLVHIQTGGVQQALQQFQRRLGTDEIYRLCGALIDIERGIDQTATLNYLADDMARQVKLNAQKKLSTRPGRMRLTYLPAVFVCVAMIIYVLVMFVINQLNNLF